MKRENELSKEDWAIVAGNLLLTNAGELPPCRGCAGYHEQECRVFQVPCTEEDTCEKFVGQFRL